MHWEHIKIMIVFIINLEILQMNVYRSKKIEPYLTLLYDPLLNTVYDPYP